MPDPVSVSASSSASVSTSSPIVPSGAKAAHAETKTVGVPVDYKVVDHPLSPSDPAATQAMLTDLGQQGWRLTTVYPDPQRETTRWIFVR